MTKLVGVSGAQGGGKSTLLSGLKERGWTVDDFRVSRAVQAQLGWSTLERAMDSVEVMTTFQEEVYRQKLLRDFELRRLETHGVMLTERTFADIAAYASHWCWEHVDRRSWTFDEASAWLTPYLQRCTGAQLECYDAVILLPYSPSVKWEADPHRAGAAFRNSIFEGVSRFCQLQPSIQRFTVTAEGVTERVEQVHTFLETL